MSCGKFSGIALEYDPIKVGSIDGTDTRPHDKALIRALNSNYRPNQDLSSDPKCVIFVSRLDINTNEDTIHKFFSKYGSIKSFRLVRDIVTGFSKKYAFIEYKDRKTVERVYEKANKAIIDGKEILVDYELSRTMSGWKPRRLGGGFGGTKESGQLRFGCRDRPWKRPFRLGMSYSDSNRDDGHSSKSLKFYDKRYKDKDEYDVERDKKNERQREYRYSDSGGDYRSDGKRKKR